VEKSTFKVNYEAGQKKKDRSPGNDEPNIGPSHVLGGSQKRGRVTVGPGRKEGSALAVSETTLWHFF